MISVNMACLTQKHTKKGRVNVTTVENCSVSKILDDKYYSVDNCPAFGQKIPKFCTRSSWSSESFSPKLARTECT